MFFQQFDNKINFIFNMSDEVTVGKNMDELGKFKAENVGYTLLSFIRF